MSSLLFDTNVIVYWSSDNESLAKAVNHMFYVDIHDLNAIKNLNELCISNITTFELFKNTSPDKLNKLENVIQYFSQYEVTKDILVIAARLSTEYRSIGVACSSEDLIIAATSIKFNLPILTANGNDFARPIFKDTNTFRVDYKVKDRPAAIFVQILVPQTEVVNDLKLIIR